MLPASGRSMQEWVKDGKLQHEIGAALNNLATVWIKCPLRTTYKNNNIKSCTMSQTIKQCEESPVQQTRAFPT